MTMGEPWKPREGQRAWFVDGNADVLRIYSKSGTATIQCWGRGLSEGKLLTYRGISLRSLSKPRRLVGGEYVKED